MLARKQLALRYAMLRNFRIHRRWALRLFLVVGASLFLRASLFLTFALSRGPVGFDAGSGTGPFLTFLSFGQYLVPLAILEVYLRVQDRGRVPARFAMAAGLFTVTVVMGAGILAVTLASFWPTVKKAYDNRASIADTLSTTIATRDVDQAVVEYRHLKATAPAAYNFDEDELNVLGYDLLRSKKSSQAMRIFELNAEAYPQSSNTWDSLAEAYMDEGNKPQATAYYKKSLQLNPRNTNALTMLQKLKAP